MKPKLFEVPYYHDYISPDLAVELFKSAKPVTGLPELVQIGENKGLETTDAFNFLLELYDELKLELNGILKQRTKDRKFIDERVRACTEFNQKLGRSISDPDYQTILGLQDSLGRIVMGPKNENYCRTGGSPIAPLPEFLKGPHVTLFGPPDSAKLSINAMNAFHRKPNNEPPIVETLLGKISPMWGADDEDSKTPLRQDLIESAMNLTACFDRSLSFQDGAKKYSLANTQLALPMKRFPGLALPSTFLFYKQNPIPLHLYDFALHLFKNWKNPTALCFYVPKLENEEEAKYIHKMVSTAENQVKKLHPEYVLGSVRLMIVLENPRAILRTHEIMDALFPYFAGASLGWHDYLASTARICKEDPNYRIPVKADPGIVYKYIKASHSLVADVVGSRGGIKVGGMYGILPLAEREDSLQITLRGFIEDVITQMKRNLNGFWVAHPDFVRLGLALVEAWQQRTQGNPKALDQLIKSLLPSKYQQRVLDFVEAKDIDGLDIDNPNYVRSLIVTDLAESDYVANNHPDEIRYNIFQTLQYLTDWLSGNGCVALPTTIDSIPVRVMDDLATAERSRWEVWAEIRHGRFSIEQFLQIAHEELNFIRRDLSNEQKIVQVKWDDRTASWYPISFQLMLKLMTDLNPVEFATELLMPFTAESIRKSSDPWQSLLQLDKAKYALDPYLEKLNHYFEICGSHRFATEMAKLSLEDQGLAEKIVMSFDLPEINEAASFHGNIGDSRQVLDKKATAEQALVLQEQDSARLELKKLGDDYKMKFGMKFLISAKGKSAGEIKSELQRRIHSSPEQELTNARLALWQISKSRMDSVSPDLLKTIEDLRQKSKIAGVAISINSPQARQNLCFGDSTKGQVKVRPETKFEIASLSKSIAAAFAMEYFSKRNVDLTSSVNQLLATTNSNFRLSSTKNPKWADQVTLENLLNHTALNMHYVKGFSAKNGKSFLPPLQELINAKHGYEALDVASPPGAEFHYSGGGFLVLQHLIESLENKPIALLTKAFLESLGIHNLSFDLQADHCADAYLDSGEKVPEGRLSFPEFAAGALGSAESMSVFLQHLTVAFHSVEGSAAISHNTAVKMALAVDKGAIDFMGCRIGLGVFVAEAGPNKLMIHQGANEGFRSLYIQCFQGPDQGKGLVIFCNGDNSAVPFIANVTQLILRELKIQGIDFAKFANDFEFGNLAQEQIVNLGYKKLLFEAFEPNLPEEIVTQGPLDPLANYNLAVKSKISQVTNQKFARAENLISAHLPIFDPELYGDQGKIMDSWESSRHNSLNCDSLILELASAEEINFISLSTKFHDGNHPEFVRVLGLHSRDSWQELIPKTRLMGHSIFQAKLPKGKICAKIKVEMFPDGGLSRIGLFAHLPSELASQFKLKPECVRFADDIPKPQKPLSIDYAPQPDEISKNLQRAPQIDWACSAFGGKILNATNEHYGPAKQVISPYPAINMFDGLESARSREPQHHEEATVRLGKPIYIRRIEFDFTFFVNNNPNSISVEAKSSDHWISLIPKTEVKAFAGNRKIFALDSKELYQELLIKTFPDGGVGRIKVFGDPAD